MLNTILLLAALQSNTTHTPISKYALGFSAAQDLADTPETNVIRMADKTGGYFRRLSLVMKIVWGTSVTLNVKCKASGESASGDFGWIQDCTPGSPHNCEDKIWQWEPADGTTPMLDLSTNYMWLICTFDDPADGTGTIQVHGIRGL